jgi:glycosyltransferase involved in cell wall biosynthesis
MTFPSKHKAKILVFSPWYPPHIGGLESHAEQFNQELVKRHYQILVLTPLSSAGGLVREEGNDALTILRFPAFESFPKFPLPAIWLSRWRSVWREAHAFDPDIVISRTRFFATTALAYWYSRRTKKPWLHIEHGSDYVQFDRTITAKTAYWYDRIFSAWLLRRAQELVANSAASAQFTRGLANRKDVAIIYRGVEHDTLTNIAPAARPVALTEKTVIAYIGRLIDGKGVPLLLHVLANLPPRTFHCYIIGSGPQDKKLHALAEQLRLTEHITFFSHLPWPKTIAYLKSADICVNPSYTEGLPTSLIEAALCGTVVVATNVGGTSEILSNQVSGLLVPPNDQPALQHALEQLIADPKLRRHLATRAQAIVRQKFKWTASIDAYEKIFARLRKL